MTFVSYAQNFEDVMLWRALRHVGHGFYLDVGAQDPVVDSVSLAFYEHGWRGVHIEPTRQYSDKLREARPDEVVLQLAVGRGEGTTIIYEFKDTGLSTANAEIAERHQEAGYMAVRTEVPVISLDSVFEKYGVGPVHWLKLDVEGLEASVLESWRTSTTRPWIIVVESTKPATQEQCHQDWESLVLEKNYCFAYFDGLNRFYVHEDHRELLESFGSPPNIFDRFVLSGTASQPFYQLVADKVARAEAMAHVAEAAAMDARAAAEQANTRAREEEGRTRAAVAEAQRQMALAEDAWARAQDAEARAQQALERECSLYQTLQSVYGSRSWRITAPLRWANSQWKRLRQEGRFARRDALINISLRRLAAIIDARPGLRRKIMAMAQRFGFFAKLRALYWRTRRGSLSSITTSTNTLPAGRDIDPALAGLTTRARAIYLNLKVEIARQERKKH